jgi:Protein of unknown function (DUF1207)
VVVCCLLFAAISVSATAASGPAEDDSPAATEARAAWIFFPEDDVYPQYIADPLRPQSAMLLTGFTSSGIPDSGDSRFVLRLGGRYSIARRHPAGEPDRGLQIDFEGGFFSQFDATQSLDNIGWDGVFGLRLSYKGDGPWAFSAGTRHDSGHVGDEYARRTGRERIDYTREEFVLGASWAPSDLWRTYLETGWGFNRIASEKPLRLQVGVEYSGRERLWRGDLPWYAALDVTAYKEDDVRIRTCAQLGLMFQTGRGTNRYRAALEFGSGRSVLGEFSPYDETYIALGWYFDF